MTTHSTLAITALTLLLAGCTYSRYVDKNYEVDVPTTVTVGSTMIAWEEGVRSTSGQGSSFSQELLYGGIANNVLQISYREYSSGYAREAFYQELKYDITANKTITFRDIILEIQEATSSSITFVVVKEPEHLQRALSSFGSVEETRVHADDSTYVLQLATGELVTGKVTAVEGDRITFRPLVDGVLGARFQISKAEVKVIRKD